MKQGVKSLKYVMIILLLVLSLAGCNRGQKVIVATVDEYEVTESLYKIYLWSTQQFYEQQAGDGIWDMQIDGRKAEEVAKERALESVVVSVVVEREADKMGISLSEEQEETVVRNATNFIEVNDDFALQYGFGQEDAEHLFRTTELSTLLQQEIAKSYMPPQDEIEKFVEQQKYNYQSVTVRHILISKLDEAGNLLPTDVRTQKEELALELLERVKSGEPIEDLAAQYSDDIVSKDNNGEYTFSRNTMISGFEEIAFSLAEGEIAGEVIETEIGYHIIQKVKNNEADEEVIREEYIRQMQIEFAQAELFDLVSSVQVKKTPVYEEITINRGQ